MGLDDSPTTLEILLHKRARVFNIQPMISTYLRPIICCIALTAFSFSATAKVKEKKVPVILETSLGTIELELDNEKAPISVKNFLNYVDKKFYDGLVFHRVIDNFMAQGGGFNEKLQVKPTDAPIKNEANNGLKNDLGTIAMARTPDPNSATSQFYINLKNNDFLNYKGPMPQDYGYAVFGKVVKGMDIVQKIGKVQTTSSGQMRDVPKVPVVIKSIRKKSTAAPNTETKK